MIHGRPQRVALVVMGLASNFPFRFREILECGAISSSEELNRQEEIVRAHSQP